MESHAELLELRRCHISGVREHFMLDEELCRDWVLLAPMSGTFAFEIVGEPAEPGQCEFGRVVISPPGTVLRRRVVAPTCFCFAEFTADGGLPIGMSTVQDLRRLGSTYGYMADVRDRRRGGGGREMRHLVADLLLMVVWARADARRPDDPLARRAAVRIEERASRADLSLGALARELNLSASQLTRRFRAAHGVTPIEYCTELRLARARQMLLDSDRPVAAIAAECGYANPFYFSRVFSKRTGQSPTTFRVNGRV